MAQSRKDGKIFVFGKDARDALLRGSQTVYDAVTLTYGPKGLNVGLEKTYGRPVVTRDGVTVARESYLENREDNIGAQLVIEASQTTNRNAGDGTTQTVALTHNLVDLGIKQINNGDNAMDIKKQILDDSYKVLENLKTMGSPVADGQLKQVASVSCGDEALGQLIAEAVEKVGPDGGVLTEKAPIEDVERTYVDGYFLQQGFSAINEGKKEVENPYVVISSKIIGSGLDIITLLNKVGEKAHIDQKLALDQPLQEPLRISFFGEFEGEAYQTIIANIQKGVFDGTITKTPPMGDMGVQYLEDLATYTGGKVITAGDRLSEYDVTFVGRADKVTCTISDTTVFGGNGSGEDIEKRKADLRDRIAKEEIDAISEKLKDRLAKLENKVAMFRIGGATETEREEKEFRIEDAIQATRAAASHGVVTGGGITLLKLSKTVGLRNIFRNALYNVFKKLMTNANLPADVKLLEALDLEDGYGFNLRESGDAVDLVKAGILDPVLVVEEVIKNASSTAANLVSMGALITFIDKED
jgi:chaperonin GroEL